MDIPFLIAFSVLLILGSCFVLYYTRKASRRCRYCRVSTQKVKHLPEVDEIRSLLENEEMPGTVAHYELCPDCKRLYDWRWLDDERLSRRDGEMHDRQCACGFNLKALWAVNPDISKKALPTIPSGILQGLYQKYGKETLTEKLYDRLEDDNVLFLCSKCRRIYAWQIVEEYQVLQCISEPHPKYDPDPFDKYSKMS